MALSSRNAKRLLGVIGVAAAFSLALAGCSGSNTGSSSGGTITVGTTDKVTSIDPAGSYDNGSFAIMNQVYPFLMNSKPGTSKVTPDIAVSASFTTPHEYTVKLKSGLKFANGHKLTSSDVKFSFDRQQKIASPVGPSSLLSDLQSTTTPNATTVVFHLKSSNSQVWPQILSSPAAPIVDEQVFSATKVTPDTTIVKGDAFAGQYTISSYKFNQLVQFKANPDYKGNLGKPENSTVDLKTYADESNMKLDVQQGDIDVAARSLSATDVDSLSKNKNVTITKGPGGELRYIVFNFATMPFGTTTADADPAKSLAVRQAAADLIDRQAIASQVYKGTYLPLYSYVPDGLTGANTALKGLYGDGKGGPSLDKAKQTLAAAGVTVPITLDLQYNTDHYGASSSDEYALVKSQLENGGLFKVNLQSTEYVQYNEQRTTQYPEYQLGWFPDYSDADDYLSPFFLPTTDSSGKTVDGGFLANNYNDPAVDKLIKQEASETNQAKRVQEIQDVQDKIASQLSTLPLLQGAQVVASGKDVKGVVLDGSFKFRFGTLHK
jgi:peptide/nickel transport system substrate-binding protein